MENEEYNFLFDNQVVLDVGCNIGTFSLWIYPMASEIHAVDSEAEHIANFNKTIQDNNLTKIKTYTQKVTDLARFMSENNINKVDVLKLDVEGDELGLVNLPTFPSNRIKTIIGEHHYPTSKAIEFEDRLKQLGYNYIQFPNNHFKATK